MRCIFKSTVMRSLKSGRWTLTATVSPVLSFPYTCPEAAIGWAIVQRIIFLLSVLDSSYE